MVIEYNISLFNNVALNLERHLGEQRRRLSGFKFKNPVLGRLLSFLFFRKKIAAINELIKTDFVSSSCAMLSGLKAEQLTEGAVIDAKVAERLMAMAEGIDSIILSASDLHAHISQGVREGVLPRKTLAMFEEGISNFYEIAVLCKSLLPVERTGSKSDDTKLAGDYSGHALSKLWQ